MNTPLLHCLFIIYFLFQRFPQQRHCVSGVAITFLSLFFCRGLCVDSRAGPVHRALSVTYIPVDIVYCKYDGQNELSTTIREIREIEERMKDILCDTWRHMTLFKNKMDTWTASYCVVLSSSQSPAGAGQQQTLFSFSFCVIESIFRYGDWLSRTQPPKYEELICLYTRHRILLSVCRGQSVAKECWSLTQ